MLLTLVLSVVTVLSWELKDYNPIANPSSIIQTNYSRITILTSYLFRLEYDPNGNFEDRATVATKNRYLPSVQFTSSINNGVLTVVTSENITIKYTIDKPFSNDTLNIVGNNVNGISYDFRTSGNPSYDNSISRNLLGTIRSLDTISSPISLNCTLIADKQVHGESLHCTWSPFGRNGYALIDDSNTSLVANNWVLEDTNNNFQDWYFFGHGLDYKAALYDFQLIQGSIPLIPRYALGSMHCRWYDYSDWSLRRAVTAQESRELPLDVTIIDMDWHKYGPWGAYSWNYNLFPYPNLTQNWLSNKGLVTSANLHDANGIQTFEKTYNEVAQAINWDTNNGNIPFNVTSMEYMMALEDITLHVISQEYESDNFPPEFNNAKIQSSKRVKNGKYFTGNSNGDIPNTLQNGFNFWWIDWQQGGNTGVYYSNINTTIWLNYVRSTDTIRNNINIRGMVLARYGGYGNQRYQIGFSGDVGHNWKMLPELIYYSSTASNVGFTFWSHDIMGAADDYELDVRWTQAGAYSPIFRVHDAGGGTGGCIDTSKGCPLVDIWDQPYKYFDINRKALQYRSSLLPYLYNSSRNAYKTGVGIIRQLYYENSDMNDAYLNKHEYYLGSGNMIVSPVTNSSGGYFNLTLWNLWLPPGNWFEYHSGIWINGNKYIQRYFDLSEVPMYIREGTILVRQPFERRYTIGRASEYSYTYLRFEIFPYNDITSGSTYIYEDDGISYDYLTEEGNTYCINNFNYVIDSNNKFTATISTEGAYPLLNTNRRYSVEIHNVFPPIQSSVKCNGEVMNYIFNWFDSSDNIFGWYYNGIDMSVIVDCPSTITSQDLIIEMEFNNNWNNNYKILDNIKGEIYRSFLSKNALDEQNVNYGTDRDNLTQCSVMGLRLGEVAGIETDSSYPLFTSLVNSFQNRFSAAIAQVKGLSGVDYLRQQYAINTVDTIRL